VCQLLEVLPFLYFRLLLLLPNAGVIPLLLLGFLLTLLLLAFLLLLLLSAVVVGRLALLCQLQPHQSAPGAALLSGP
jgi:hypothetical protein